MLTECFDRPYKELMISGDLLQSNMLLMCYICSISFVQYKGYVIEGCLIGGGKGEKSVGARLG